MESSSFSDKELVKPDFLGAYRTLRHDAGVLFRALQAPKHTLLARLGPPPAREIMNHNRCSVAGRNMPGAA